MKIIIKKSTFNSKDFKKESDFMETIQMLKMLCQVNGVAGSEDRALDVAEKICNDLGPCKRTVHNSLVCEVMKGEEGAPHLMLDAHIDEIGLTVTHIEDNGFLRVAQCGGVDRRIVMASPVVVHSEKGDFPGVIGSIPPHIQTGEKKNPKIEDIWVDIGMSGEEAKEVIELGDKISFVGPFTELENNLVSSKANDDRCCCVAIIKAAEEIKKYWGENNLSPISLTLVFSSQEETGCLGAATAAFEINPTEAIAVDVSFASTPEIANKHFGWVYCDCELNKGPIINIGAVLSRRMSKRLAEIGKEKNIPHQVEVMGGGSTGTNADKIVSAGAGIEACVVSVPLRYMHTPIETISIDDVNNAAKLIASYAISEYAR